MSSTEVQAHCSRYQLRRFFRTWMQDPLAVGAIVPSGRLLAKLMVMDVQPGARVVELGAGTGTLTQAILEAGVAPSDLVVIEQNSDFVEILRHRFPESEVLQANAMRLTQHLDAAGAPVDFIISGLPLLLFSRPDKARVLAEAFSLLRDGGRFHQFTYAGRCPVSRSLLRSMQLESSLIGVAPFNFPPAFVYRLQRLRATVAPAPRE